MNVLINRFLIPKISADLENLAKPPPPPVLTRPSEKLPEWVASLEGSTFLYGCISRSGHHDYIIDNYDKLAVSIFLRVQDSQGKLHGISRTLEIPIRYGPGRLVNKSLSVNLFGGEQYRLVFYDLEAMRLKLSNMFGSALPIRALTKLPESVTSPDQSQSIGQELSKQPGPNTPGEWIKACIAEQQQRDDDAWSEQQWINREFTVQSKLCPGRSFVIPMRILLKEILIEDETWIRTIEHTDEINVNPETGMVTIGIKTPSGVRQIEWARLDIIKDQVQALPATSYNPDTLKKKRGLAGLFHSISNFGVTNDWPPNTNELFKFVYHKPYWAVDPSTNRRIRAHEQLTTGCGYVDPASGYLQPDCREPLNIRLEPRVVVNQDSVEVVWMDRAARPRNLRERD
jgi:hypothetical protein